MYTNSRSKILEQILELLQAFDFFFFLNPEKGPVGCKVPCRISNTGCSKNIKNLYYYIAQFCEIWDGLRKQKWDNWHLNHY